MIYMLRRSQSSMHQCGHPVLDRYASLCSAHGSSQACASAAQACASAVPRVLRWYRRTVTAPESDLLPPPLRAMRACAANHQGWCWQTSMHSHLRTSPSAQRTPTWTTSLTAWQVRYTSLPQSVSATPARCLKCTNHCRHSPHGLLTGGVALHVNLRWLISGR